MTYKEINIICVGDLRYRFKYNDIEYFENINDMFRIYFKDGSILEYNKNNMICVEYVR